MELLSTKGETFNVHPSARIPKNLYVNAKLKRVDWEHFASLSPEDLKKKITVILNKFPPGNGTIEAPLWNESQGDAVIDGSKTSFMRLDGKKFIRTETDKGILSWGICKDNMSFSPLVERWVSNQLSADLEKTYKILIGAGDES